jgi:transcriptional regulator
MNHQPTNVSSNPAGGVGIGWRLKVAETDQPILHQFIRDHPLDTSRFMLDASEAPASDDASPPPLGALRGHIARKNPHAIASIAACYSQDSDPTETATSQALDQEVMIVFNSPVESYVSPSFYTHSKPLDGKVIPTWFFSAVQVYGNLTIHASTRSATAT